MVEIMKKIFEKDGYAIDYDLLPWNRSIKEVEEGKYDAIIGASTECPTCVAPKEAIASMCSRFYVKKGKTWRYNGPDSLKKVIVGVIADYSYTKAFDAYIEKNKTDSKKVSVMFGDGALEHNIQRLLSGHGVDTIVENPLVINWVLTRDLKMKENVIEEAGELENSRILLFAKFSGKKATSRIYADIYDKGIAELRKTGELKKILAKYNMKDWK
jgi:polar amino acid transport system substrate-binding protein